MGHDVIGDVHGNASALVALLEKLGYRERAGVYRHPVRKAIFVGDFIDRGPEQVRTVTIARKMIDAGTALAVMGNHELNAIAWFLDDPDAPGEHLRRHRSLKYGDKNREQHEAFLAEVEHRRPLHEELVDWFLTLPLWLDLPELRVVHACWHPRFMQYVAGHLQAEARLTRELMVPATREPPDEAAKDTPEPTVFKAVEALTKGIEIRMPAGLTFRDKDGHVRDRVRVRWWDEKAITYRDAALLTLEERAGLPATPIPAHARIGYSDPKPVFVGHYWFTDTPAPLAPNAACLDYSIGKGGRLCAYRYDGEPALEAARFVSVGPSGVP
ncbi:metallophosphoesterase [Anaeromyxobacter oryzae]|uniref:Metallophosphatase n=1 Tax=Anaeromyxobacter oryzae TaxID=2918170 RepID=A0ABN6MRJ6_9BACT|nr:metallophosphoesterase [Anaeromyxobacter oryzae]BDG02875.1 metallophosphatase [Anaeromyxobacter oryzae]